MSSPPQLPPLVKGEQIQSGPYTVTVTDAMVAQREKENERLYRAWLKEQRRRQMSPDEEGSDFMGDFKDKDVRRIFIRKVFIILTIQLLFTALFIALFLFVDEARQFLLVHWYLWVVALVTFTIAYCAISCSEYARRQSPCNYICLFLLTLAMSYLAAFASVSYDVNIIFMALSMTAIITLLIGLLATFSKFDLTMRAGLVAIVGLVSVVSIVVMIIVLMFTYVKLLHLIISLVGCLLLSMYLYFDVQTLMGGRAIELSPNEVVFATTQIYVDVILLYQYVLMFMGVLHNHS